MTKSDLKVAIDTYIGLHSTIENQGEDEAKLIYTSPTGIVLFEISIGEYGKGWHFSGHSGALNLSWKDLVKFGK